VSHRRRYQIIRIAAITSTIGLVAFAMLLTSPEAVAQRGRGARVEFEPKPHEGNPNEAGAAARPPKYEPVGPVAARRADPIGWKSSTRMPGSARLRTIGRPFDAPVGARPPSGRASGPKILTVVPKSKEAFRNTFDKSPSEAESRELDASIGRFGERSQNLGSFQDGPAQLHQSFREAAAAGHDSVIVVGHSIGAASGPRELKLPDGSKVKLEEVYEWAAAEGLECRVATCYGRDFGIDAPVALGRVARLLTDVAWPVELIAPKPSEAGTPTAGGPSEAATNPGPLNDWDDWDDQFSRRRDELGYSDVVLVGATRDGDGRLHLWESVRARPTWLALSAWLILVAGIVANASVMQWMHRQELNPAGSLDEIEREVAERFRRSRRLERLTVVAVGLTLVVAIVTAVLIRHERRHDAATGRATHASLVNVPAPLGVFLMTLSALAARVDPDRARLARLVHSLSGAIAGTLAMFLRVLKYVGGVGLILFSWVSLLQVVACWYNGFSKLQGMALNSLWWCAVVSGGLSAAVALRGTYQGALAGYHDLPVFLAVRLGVGRMAARRGSPPDPVPAGQPTPTKHREVQPEVVTQTPPAHSKGDRGGVLVLILAVLGASAIYVYYLIEEPPYPNGARVIFVGESKASGLFGPVADEIEQIDAMFYPATVPVYQAPADRTRSLEEIRHALLSPMFPAVEHDIDLELFPEKDPSDTVLTTLDLNPKEIAEYRRLRSEQIATRERERERVRREREQKKREREKQEDLARRLRGPSGIVFSRGSAKGGVVDGVVVQGSQGVIVADDQGGKGDRAVLVRLVRDPAFGDDPGVIVVARAADLRALPVGPSPPGPGGHSQEPRP
jgi:hypothetical protein